MALDPARTSIRIHTFAEGLFSRLAHDLEIEAGDVTGNVNGDAAEIEVPVASLRVVGAVKKGRVDTSTLSASDRADIEEKIRGEVLTGGGSVRVTAELEGTRARLTIATPAGGRATVACDVAVTKTGEEIEASGRCDVSLRALGIAPVKGPMGAFRLSDRVEVVFRAVVRT